ncbi:MAG TPA: DUF4194 domain-containing protein [Paraburkholderia sp.]|uniref:DUF4194 domain-containing protein n=1 Tax=Paraburkholderia sp. TaxID=1926495 RepID=UPI002B4595FB|nr:DUF4194 domain-containing protein [Paraburkholderia sp.]HKR45810.1 DUF4194 domain-containing protein [Paraburkholderia sp.]
MFMSVQQYIEERLNTEGSGFVTPERFGELLGRLLASGVLWRDYSAPEAELYEDAVQCEQLLREYTAAMRFVLTHDVDASLFRLYPPGEGGEPDDDGVKRLKARLSRDFIASCVALRFLYTEALTGKREMENQVLTISLEELSQTVVSLLAHQLPSSIVDRGAMLRDLRKHRIIKFNDSDSAGNMETLINVLRPVMTYVSDEALDDALRVAGENQKAASNEDVEVSAADVPEMRTPTEPVSNPHNGALL